MLKETSNATELRLEEISMVSYDEHGLLPQPKWFTGSPTNCKQQCLDQIRQAFINIPEKGEKIFFALKHIVQRDACFENFGKPEQICKFPGIIVLQIQ